ncbi:MAG: exodeoxyribonuclease VII small subunit, partial [Anaerolineae bacterium]
MKEALEKLSFEDASQELEAAVRRLEEGELTLEEAIALYERGMGLARRCGEALDAA